jgi:hypothetical protein
MLKAALIGVAAIWIEFAATVGAPASGPSCVTADARVEAVIAAKAQDHGGTDRQSYVSSYVARASSSFTTTKRGGPPPCISP